MKKSILICFFLLAALPLFASGVERYAIYVGCNDGGTGRQKLLYAGTDAENFKKTMGEVGGITDNNSYLLIDPTKKEINTAIESITRKIESNKSPNVRSEFVFYYSGHSDEEALLLGETRYDYSSLKQTITEIPSDIHVVILDSCYSGNFIRTKGGQKKKPFLVDDSSVVKGHAYLSSSSETEASQESDEIGASYFTNSVITGLRGAADTSGDKKVTLTELYSYAFNETLKNTEDAQAGPQHPNYNITLVGSGDLVLSDFSASDSIVSIGSSVKGKIMFRDSNGKLISEINKTENVPVMIALPAGSYSVVVVGESAMQGNFSLKKDEAFVLEEESLKKLAQKETTVRGGSKKENLSRAELHSQHRNGGEDSQSRMESLKMQEESDYVEQETEEFKNSKSKHENRKSEPEKNEVTSSDLNGDFSIDMKMPFRIGKGAYADRWYMREDMTIPSVATVAVEGRYAFPTIGSSVPFIGCGSEFAFQAQSRNDGFDFDNLKFEILLQPCIGFFFHDDKSGLTGIGFAFYPYYDIPVYSDYDNDSYYSYKNAFEIDLNGLFFKNMSLGLFVRFVGCWKNGQVSPSVSTGLSWGTTWPGKKH